MRELDYLRAFAILGIVAIHVGAFSITIGYPNAISPITDFIAHFSDFGIPLFFFVSGFILAVRYFEQDRRGGFYRRRLGTIIPPYLAFSTVYLLYAAVALGQTSLYRAAWSYLLFDATGIFWFLAVIIQMYLLFPYLAAWLGRLEAKGQAWRVPAYAALLYVAWYAYLQQATADLLNATWQPVPDLGGIVAGELFPGFLLFFVLGMYLARTVPSSRSVLRSLSRTYMVVPLLLMAVGLQLLGSGFWWEMAVVPYSLVASALLLRLSRWLAARPGALSSGSGDHRPLLVRDLHGAHTGDGPGRQPAVGLGAGGRGRHVLRAAVHADGRPEHPGAVGLEPAAVRPVDLRGEEEHQR